MSPYSLLFSLSSLSFSPVPPPFPVHTGKSSRKEEFHHKDTKTQRKSQRESTDYTDEHRLRFRNTDGTDHTDTTDPHSSCLITQGRNPVNPENPVHPV